MLTFAGVMTSLAQEIKRQAGQLVLLIEKVPEKNRREKVIPFTWADISVQDLLAYQIGWGKLLLNWYCQGLKGEKVVMPGEGFTKWDYQGLAKHFFKKYSSAITQDFVNLTQEIIDIVKKEEAKGRLSTESAFAWCTLPSGKQWTLEKWIRVNTCSPYKRAISLLKNPIRF